MEEAIIVLILGLGGVLSAVGVGGQRRFKRMDDLEEEREKLLKRITALEQESARVPELQRQVEILTQQLGDMQLRLSEAEKTLDGKERELERLTDENTAQKVALKERDEHIKALGVRVETYERALQLVGGERAHAAPEPAPESAEKAADDAAQKEQGRGD